MKCSLCSKKAVAKIQKDDYCSACYTRIIDKRLRKYCRINKIFKKGDNILVIGDLAEHFVKNIIQNLPVKIKALKRLPKSTKGYTKVVLPITMEDEICNFLDQLFSKDFKLKKQNKKTVKLFKVISEEELKVYCKINKLNFKKRNPDRYTKILDTMEKKYPQTRYSVLNSMDKMSD